MSRLMALSRFSVVCKKSLGENAKLRQMLKSKIKNQKSKIEN